MEKTFETKLVDGMGGEGEKHGWGRTFTDWTEEQVQSICMTAIGFLRSLPTYKGQFDYLFAGQQHTGPVTQPVAPPGQQGTNLSDLRRDLANAMQALIERQIGEKPNPAQMKAALASIAPECPNEMGHTGEIPESLAKCTDVVWVRNMLAFVNEQIRTFTANGGQEDSTIPF